MPVKGSWKVMRSTSSLSAVGSRWKEISWRGAALLALFLTAFVWLVFVGGLGVRLPFFRMPF